MPKTVRHPQFKARFEPYAEKHLDQKDEQIEQKDQKERVEQETQDEQNARDNSKRDHEQSAYTDNHEQTDHREQTDNGDHYDGIRPKKRLAEKNKKKKTMQRQTSRREGKTNRFEGTDTGKARRWIKGDTYKPLPLGSPPPRPSDTDLSRRMVACHFDYYFSHYYSSKNKNGQEVGDIIINASAVTDALTNISVQAHKIFASTCFPSIFVFVDSLQTLRDFHVVALRYPTIRGRIRFQEIIWHAINRGCDWMADVFPILELIGQGILDSIRISFAPKFRATKSLPA